MRIEIPEFALVAMIGATSSGKTTFAHKHFKDTEVLSSDFFRAMVCDDENDQTVSSDAFELLYFAANKRLDRMKTTVIDATNLSNSARQQVLELAHKQNVHSVAIVLDLPEKELMQRNKNRADRGYPDRVIHSHFTGLRKCIRHLKKDGFRFVYVLGSQEEIDNAEIVRTKLWNDKRDLHGPFDIIGDIHGCFDELVMLLEKLGYIKNETGIFCHPFGRQAAFLGDLCDRGTKNTEVLRLVMDMVKSGNAIAVPGNHDVKLLKYLRGKSVQKTHGLDITVSQLDAAGEDFRNEVTSFLDGLVSHYVLDDSKLVISHAGIKQKYIGRGSMRVRDFCLYGETTGETDEYGLPVRLDWAADYRGRATVVYGHIPQTEVQALNGTYCIDTGCVFGGKLTALRYPEKECVSVKALHQYYEPVKPLSEKPTEPDDILTLGDIGGKLYLQTKLMPSINIHENNSAAALEIMSRFAADPHWLIYLPPTMSPCKTSELECFLEHPLEAFEYYRSHGVGKVICEKKHMGSRAVIVLCRNAESAKKRFRITDGSRGIIYTRTGRQFFTDNTIQNEVLDRLDAVLTKTGFWSDFNTDWVCFDTELMPWSEKAQELLEKQYAPVGRAGRDGLAAVTEALDKLCQRKNVQYDVPEGTSGENFDPDKLLAEYKQKKDAMDGYVRAYREYCWNVKSVDDLKIAPFHILAVEGQVFSDKEHIWHMETIRKYCTGTDPIFIATDHIAVDVNDESSVQRGIAWWLSLTGNGGEGMVVKPEFFTAKYKGEVIQPAVKCRGREYLRIIYGPEYLIPENLKRLKSRSLTRKRSLALREFSLGMESLDRFVMGEPLYRVHECVFGVLALESEPVDPRL